jgi:hypothetical protein
LDKVTAQVVEALASRLVDAHCRVETAIAETKENVTGLDEPLKEAVTVAVWSAESVPVAAVKVADVELAGTRTDDGTVNTVGAVLVSATVAPAPEAALDNVAVQVVEALAARLILTHWREERVIAETKENVTGLEEPLREAVTVAVWSVASRPVVALKVAEVEPAGTRTEAGTVNAVGALLARATVAPDPEAALDNVTVQVVEALPARVVDAH